MRALVVDDSHAIRRLVMKTLARVGIRDVVEATDGVDALARLAAARFDLILLDWNMPRMTGIEMLRILRRKANRTPVIMVTTEAQRARVLEAVQAGANDYLIKPFTPEQLAEKIRHVFPALG